MAVPDIKKALEKVNLAAVVAIKAGEDKAAKIIAVINAAKKEAGK